MKRIYEFSVSTRYAGSKVVDEIELEFPDNASEEEIERDVESAWKDWMSDEIDGGWSEINLR